MLQIGEDVRFIATAKINLKGRKAEFNVECKLLDSDKLLALRNEQKDGHISVADFIKAWLTGWPEGEVCDKDGQTMAFSDEAVNKLLNQPGAPMALVEAFYEGYDPATEGNSAPLPAGS